MKPTDGRTLRRDSHTLLRRVHRHQQRADPALETLVRCEYSLEIRLAQDVELQLGLGADGLIDRATKIRRDPAESFAEVQLLLVDPAFIDLGDPRPDEVVAIAVLALADDRLAL